MGKSMLRAECLKAVRRFDHTPQTHGQSFVPGFERREVRQSNSNIRFPQHAENQNDIASRIDQAINEVVGQQQTYRSIMRQSRNLW